MHCNFNNHFISTTARVMQQNTPKHHHEFNYV